MFVPYWHLPLFARVTIERADACNEMRTASCVRGLLRDYAKVMAMPYDPAVTDAVLAICKARFPDWQAFH